MRTGTDGEMGEQKPLLWASPPPAKSCYKGQQVVNQACVPFYHLCYLGRAVPFPTASAQPGTGCLLMPQRCKVMNLYSFPAQYNGMIYLCCRWERCLMHCQPIRADAAHQGRTVPYMWGPAEGKTFISLQKTLINQRAEDQYEGAGTSGRDV